MSVPDAKSVKVEVVLPMLFCCVSSVWFVELSSLSGLVRVDKLDKFFGSFRAILF